MQARRDTKALQTEHERLERTYEKPVSQQVAHGDQGIYRETIEAGKQRYAVIENEQAIKLVSCDNNMEKYKGRAVTVELSYDEKQGRERVSLTPSRERTIGGRDRSDDFDINR